MEWSKKQLSILAIVAVTSFIGTFLISSVNIALPAIEKSFSLGAVTLSWVVTSFLLATAMFLLPSGRWADISGVRRMFKWGVVIFTFSSLACGLSPSGFWLILFRFLQGIGGAFSSTTGPAILVSAFLPQYRGRVLGISVSAVYLGLAFGPFAGGLFTQYLGWRSIFYASTVLGIATTTIAFLFLGNDEQPTAKGKPFGARGIFFYMLGLVVLVYGSSQIPSVFGWLLMGGGLLALVVFWMIERKTAMPVIETRLFTQNRLFAYSNMAALINYSATFAIVFLLSLYLQKIRSLAPRDAGLILIAQPTVMAIFSPIAGRLSDRVQPRYLTTLGMTMCTLGLAAFTFLSMATPLGIIIGLLVWVGLGFAFFSSPNMNTIMSSVAKNQYGLASGSAATMRVLGQIISMTIVTLYFAGFFGKSAIESVPSDVFLSAMKWGFGSFTLISASGIYFSFYRGKIDRNH
ncbi:MAG TPA: MFS transporter [Marinilabiliales bacterium]|nr:MAG: transporter [Bacteroidetes bacterium GWA2_40_14]OFX59889.1 MAG: transporter [Bacteroidetes bacterium GWC2_40_13]OFX75112.1 MAG: transporter [Bacteroidetes bacterium GWD2_40_43]OFX93839.1 MAG: transporter [Bacteroidetes bacterium GWE2_40_63]OFY18088.1 MAG: transporter [Bacteroidetes bacterium GWF2_40_13]OFZ27318.1 MAG: transporter [Bacteroidetes bacterium RIFOXYC2_FULL_40_12]HAM98998.1 MFS transporter [Marinilabiliales bacterium]